jgi:anaerobic selenocysteine-containing dehydrogenase
MYHSWGSHNAWLRQIIELNRLYVNRAIGTALGLADGDWAWVVSHHGRVKVQLQLMEGCEPNTVWTWNGIGKRAGAWNLDVASGEAHRGFLLNHVIPELLPERDGMRLSNSDPVTGQAAWYDVKVRLEKCLPNEPGETAPLLPPLRPPKGLPMRPSLLRYGAEWRR